MPKIEILFEGFRTRVSPFLTILDKLKIADVREEIIIFLDEEVGSKFIWETLMEPIFHERQTFLLFFSLPFICHCRVEFVRKRLEAFGNETTVHGQRNCRCKNTQCVSHPRI